MCVGYVVDNAYVGYCVDGDDWGSWVVLVFVLVIVLHYKEMGPDITES